MENFTATNTNELLFVTNGTSRVKQFEVDFDKVNSIEDIKIVLKALNFSIHWYNGTCPDQFKEIYEKGLLIEIK